MNITPQSTEIIKWTMACVTAVAIAKIAAQPHGPTRTEFADHQAIQSNNWAQVGMYIRGVDSRLGAMETRLNAAAPYTGPVPVPAK